MGWNKAERVMTEDELEQLKNYWRFVIHEVEQFVNICHSFNEESDEQPEDTEIERLFLIDARSLLEERDMEKYSESHKKVQQHLKKHREEHV